MTIKEIHKRTVTLFEKFNPEKIVMFGSSIGGNWDEYSDIDIIVVYPTSKTFNQRLKELYMSWDIPRAVDILAYTPEEFDQLMRE